MCCGAGADESAFGGAGLVEAEHAISTRRTHKRFGSQPALRWGIAFIGGVLIQYGAELARGCTSGLAVSGGIVLAPGAFGFMAAMFAAGVPTARALTGRA